MRTESRPQVTCTKNLVKIELVIVDRQTHRHRQTDRQPRLSQYSAPLSGIEKQTQQIHVLGSLAKLG